MAGRAAAGCGSGNADGVHTRGDNDGRARRGGYYRHDSREDRFMLTDFYPGTTKAFTVIITFNGAAPDITADSVTFFMKRSPDDSDGNAAIAKAADVATSGASGTAIVGLSPADTAIAPRTYHYDIVWVRSTGEEYVLARGVVKVLDRVSDV